MRLVWCDPVKICHLTPKFHMFVPPPEPVAVCGPAVLTLWASLTTLDTDFFVLVSDVAPDGKTYGLQRGSLRVLLLNPAIIVHSVT